MAHCEVPFTRKMIAKAFFDLDISDSEPSIASKKSKPYNLNRRAVSQTPATNGVKASLLTLPLELRLRIYSELLVSRFNRTQNPSWAVGDTNQKLIVLHMIQAPQYRTMEPGILQTCKQIYREGNSILYSKNVFAISEPKEMFQLIERIGLVNFKLIRTLDLFVPCMAEPRPWLQLLSIIAKQASGLRDVELRWGADTEFPGLGERGLGDSLDFVHVVGEIQGLEKLVIKGYYAKNWHAYLTERMGIQVHAICGDCREIHHPTEEDLDKEDLEDMKYVHELNERELQAFKEYQQGTESLIP